MKINELKVGDRIKYYAPDSWILDTTICEGSVTEIKIDYVRIDNAFLIKKEKIISKLEPIKFVPLKLKKKNSILV